MAEITPDCSGVRVVARLTQKTVDALNLIAGRSVYAVIKAVSFDRHASSRAPITADSNADVTVI